MKVKIVSILSFLLLISACSPRTILFTQYMRGKVESQGLDLKDVQFYNSSELILQRNLTYEETKLAQGKINFENGKFIELITIKKMTPGVCESYDKKSLDVSFESGENRKLKFVLNPNQNYQVSALEWKDKYGKVKYDTLYYYIRPGGEKALLKVKKDNIFKLDKQERVAPGRKVSPSSNE